MWRTAKCTKANLDIVDTVVEMMVSTALGVQLIVVPDGVGGRMALVVDVPL